MDKLVYSVQEMQKALGVGRNVAYGLVKMAGFPTAHVGKRIVIPIEALNEWLRNGGTAQIAEAKAKSKRCRWAYQK